MNRRLKPAGETDHQVLHLISAVRFRIEGRPAQQGLQESGSAATDLARLFLFFCRHTLVSKLPPYVPTDKAGHQLRKRNCGLPLAFLETKLMNSSLAIKNRGFRRGPLYVL
jgi:hypothetical protein